MAFTNKYPYTDFHELNLDWVVEEVGKTKQLNNETVKLVDEAVEAKNDAVNAKNDAESASASASQSAASIEGVTQQVAVNTSRIDELAHLSEGSTTGDAELADIRVGFDSTTYSSAGNAVRGQCEMINAAVNDIEKNIYTLSDCVYNGILKDDGTYFTYQSLTRHTRKIKVTPGDVIVYYGVNQGTHQCAIAGFNANKEFRSMLLADCYTLVGNSVECKHANGVVVPDGISYVEFGYFADTTTTSLEFEVYIFGDSIVHGEFTIDSIVYLHKNLYGSKCTFNVGDNAIIIPEASVTIHGVDFVGNYQIPHNVNSEKESGLDSMITHDQLSTITNVLRIGEPLIQFDSSRAFNAGIIDCTFANIGRVCIWLDGKRHQSIQHPYVTGCYFSGCLYAIYANSEFNKISNISIDNCGVGIYVNGGNNNIYGCIVKRCDVGIYFVDGGNGLHGELVSCEFAHELMAGLYAINTPVNLGFVVVGCQFADASIEGSNMAGFMFDGCRLETWFDFTGSKNSIIASILTNAYAVLYGKPWFNIPVDTLRNNNRNLTGDDSLVNG